MRIIVVGGGRVGSYLVKELRSQNHVVSLVEKEKAICEQIAAAQDVLVINGDGCELSYLEDAGLECADVVAAVTGDDEDNLIICQLAKDFGKVERTVARVNDPKNTHTFVEIGVDVAVDSTAIIAKIIEEEVSMEDLATLMTFKRGKLAIVRVDLASDSPCVNKKVMEIKLPENTVLVSIIRGEQVIVPRGDTPLKEKDDIIAITNVGQEQALLDTLIGKT
jgi:trk system potassium uptake protein TrkA